MSETPPSIPPRKRPTPPAGGSGARPGGSTGTETVKDAERPAASEKSDDGAWSSGSSTPPTYTARTSTTGRSTGGSSGGTSTTTSTPTGSSGEDRRVIGTVEDPLPAGSAGTGGPAPRADEPSPLVTAVDGTTEWLKKAASSTGASLSRAYASVTRPRTEDAQMTATSASPASTQERAAAPRPTTGATSSVRPATGRTPAVGAPRRVRLAISRVDPWSVMKLAFLLSVAIGIMIVVAAAVVWFTLDGLRVFADIDGLIRQIAGTETPIDINEYVSFRKTISAATLVAVIDVFLLTALATIGAFLYNIVASLVGGVHVTMTDE